MSARENILSRIRAANKSAGNSGSDSARVAGRLSNPVLGPRPNLDWDPEEQFIRKSVASASTIAQTDSVENVPGLVNKYLTESGLPRSGVCWGEFSQLPWAENEIEMEFRPATGDDKVGVTGCDCAIAETGTLVLLSSPDQHATSSLLPETHIAVVRKRQILKTMEDVWGFLRERPSGLPRQVNFISGPSRTADIEMTLVYGAHGPYRVHIIIVND